MGVQKFKIYIKKEYLKLYLGSGIENNLKKQFLRTIFENCSIMFC